MILLIAALEVDLIIAFNMRPEEPPLETPIVYISNHISGYLSSRHTQVCPETEAQSNWMATMAKENAKEKETKQLSSLGKTLSRLLSVFAGK